MIFYERITRRDAQQHRGRIFLFGDNEARRGLGGLAKELRGEPNAVGIATKRAPSRDPSAYWNDEEFYRCAALIREDMEPLFTYARKGWLIVCPSAGIGTGLSQLPTRAPRIWEFLRGKLKRLHNTRGP